MTVYEGNCPKCGKNGKTLANGSHPCIWECVHCKHFWNPNNLYHETLAAISVATGYPPSSFEFAKGYAGYPCFILHGSTFYKAILKDCPTFDVGCEKKKWWMKHGEHGRYDVYQSIPCI